MLYSKPTRTVDNGNGTYTHHFGPYPQTLDPTDHPMQKVRDVRSGMQTEDYGSRLFCENFLPILGRRFPLYMARNPFASIDSLKNTISGKTVLEAAFAGPEYDIHISPEEIERCKQNFVRAVSGKIREVVSELDSNFNPNPNSNPTPVTGSTPTFFGGEVPHEKSPEYLSEVTKSLVHNASLRELEAEAIKVQWGYPTAVGYTDLMFRTYSQLFESKYSKIFKLRCCYARLIKPENVCIVCLADGRTLLYARPGDVHILKNGKSVKYAQEVFSGYDEEMDAGTEYHPSAVLRMLNANVLDREPFVKSVGLRSNMRKSTAEHHQLQGRKTYIKLGDTLEIYLYVRGVGVPRPIIEANRYDKERDGSIREYAEDFNPFLYKPGQFEKAKAIQGARNGTIGEVGEVGEVGEMGEMSEMGEPGELGDPKERDHPRQPEPIDETLSVAMASAIIRAWETEVMI